MSIRVSTKIWGVRGGLKRANTVCDVKLKTVFNHGQHFLANTQGGTGNKVQVEATK